MLKMRFLLILNICFVFLNSCASSETLLVGIWQCELYGSVRQIEFTADGHFIDHTALAENCYTADNDSISVYIENDPDSTVELSYKVKDDLLTFGGAEYTRITQKELLTPYPAN